MKKIFLSVFIVLIVAVCFASSVAGRWSGTIEGQYNIAVDIKEEGEGQVAGLISSEIGQIPITGGKIVGDDIIFKDLSFNGIAISYIKGKISADISYCTYIGCSDFYRCTDHWLTVSIFYGSPEGVSLRKSSLWNQHTNPH